MNKKRLIGQQITISVSKCRVKREKGQENTSSNRKQMVDITSHNTRVALHWRRDYYFIIKL